MLPVHRVVATRRYWFTAILVSLLLAAFVSPSVRAEGGASIASAPAVTYGQQEFGNMAGGAHATVDCGLFGAFGGCCPSAYRQFWSLGVTAGDLLTIDWESQVPQVELKLLPVGITDYTFSQTRAVAEQTLASNGKNELAYTASQGGAMYLDFKLCEITSAPYDFTAYVVHAVRLFIARRGHMPLSGTIAVGVHTPVGEPITDPSLQITLEIKIRGHWYTAGNATPANGTASVSFRLSARLRHQHVRLRAIAHGSAYHAASSSAIRVRVG